MARGGKRGGRGGRGRGRGGGDRRGGEDNRVSFDKVTKENARLEGYYNDVLGLPEAEQEEFWDAYKRELPNSFRFTGSKGHALAVQTQLKERYVPEISKITHFNGQMVEPPKPVPWYPDELAWWMTTPKNVVRKFPPFASFQKFLVSETSVGNISRQEVVSMIPPLVMDLQPGMTVLDMCAAPGSKAAQLLEMVHRGEEARVHKALRHFAKEDGREVSPGPKIDGDDLEVDTSDNGRATGLLIANDSDYKRSHMLIHQLKRLSSPNLIVTNHDATMYPSIKLPPTPENPASNRYLKFDRILADVPCSGDGTLRKNVNLWKDWTPGNGIGLHMTQVRILVRALQMLKVGGRVVYSTCSMNPVENEAVIVAAIERCGGLEKVKLLPTDDQLPLLKRKPGLKAWKVMDKAGKTWSDFAEVEKYNSENGSSYASEKLLSSMFAPSPTEQEIPLGNCMRVYAHQQDTGGFFISILEKTSEFKAKPESDSKKGEPKPPISAIVNEIESMPPAANGASVIPKIDAADALTGPPAPIADELTPTPVARQNQPALDATSNGKKRSADEVEGMEIDGVVSTKKLKSIDGEDEVAAPGLQDRQVHFPPPPAAKVESTSDVVDIPDVIIPQPQARVNRNRNAQQFEEPFKYIVGDHPEIQIIEKFYELSPRFPRDRFLVRNAEGEPAKTMYYTSALIRDILTENEGKGIKFIHGGVRMFMKQDVQGEGVCRWRIQSEGMPILEGYVGSDRVVRLYKKETLRKLLIEMFPKVTDNHWKNLGEIGERVRDIGMGCCVLRIEPSDEEDGFQERITLPLWRSLHSLNLMLAKEDRSAMLLRIFNDTTPLVNNSNNSKQGKKPEAADGAEAKVGGETQPEEGTNSTTDATPVAATTEMDVDAAEDEIKTGNA